MAGDYTSIIRTLQESAVNRCRERLDEAALRAKGLISTNDPDGDRPGKGDDEYGVTSILKRKHGL